MEEIYYICDRCKHTFELSEGESVTDDEGLWTACPNCGSRDIEEGQKCERCGEIVYPWNIEAGVCPDCVTECVLEYRRKLRELPDDVVEILEYKFGELDVTKREE